VEYRETDASVRRLFGFGSPRLSMGQFRSDGLGQHTRYSYTQCESCMVLTVGDEILAVSGRDRESTRAIYEELIRRCE
jgi:hypothetical protein